MTPTLPVWTRKTRAEEKDVTNKTEKGKADHQEINKGDLKKTDLLAIQAINLEVKTAEEDKLRKKRIQTDATQTTNLKTIGMSSGFLKHHTFFKNLAAYEVV